MRKQNLERLSPCPGYFGIPQCGPVFVENRHTDWRNYWPHMTLRNLWKLSHRVGVGDIVGERRA